jgi:hypothetical protein
MTKAFSRWPLKAEVPGQSQAIQCGIYIGQSATGTGFRLSVSFHTLHTHSITYHQLLLILEIDSIVK